MSKDIPKYLLVTIIIPLAVLYIPFHNKYRTDYIDDAWSFSWAYNLVEKGEVYDTVFGILDGDGGTSLFGRGYAYVYGTWGKLTGWSRPAGYVLSALFLLSTAFLWKKILTRLGYSSAFTLSFFLIMLLMEAYYGAGHRLRSDAMVFFFSTLSFYLFLKNKPFFSAFILCVAVELHPYGMVGLFYILSVFIAQKLKTETDKDENLITKKSLGLFLSGGILGITYYLLFHYRWLGELANLSDRIGGNPFIGYYFKFKYSWRHWPELFMIILGIALFIFRREYRRDKLIPVFMAMMILFSILLPRGNFHYVIFLLPPFLMLLIYMSENLRVLPLFLAGFLIFQISQYAWLFYSQKDFSWQHYVSSIEINVPGKKKIFVYGPSSSWFALMDRDFHAYGYFERAGYDDIEDLPRSLYVIDNGKPTGLESFATFYNSEELSSWLEPGLSRITIYKWEKKVSSQSR